MPKTSSIHIRVEPDVKKKVKEILDKLGMTSAEAINIYLKQIILNAGIPFEIKIPNFSEDMKEALKETEEAKRNPKKYKRYDIDELMEDLHGKKQNNKNK